MRDPHRSIRKDVPDVEVDLEGVLTISVDTMHLYETCKKQIFVAVDHDSGRVWSYALRGKTILQGNYWIQRRLAQDLENAGYKDVNAMIKSDQERSMVVLQREIQRIRTAKTIPVSSPVG